MSLPKITIGTVTYQAGTTLERNIQSIAAQTYPHWEHLLADGGSTDDTLDIIRRYQNIAKPHFAWWISEPDHGRADAMNKVLAHATGDWILFLQGDDYFLSPDSLQQALPILQASSADIIGFPIVEEFPGPNPRRAIRQPKAAWKFLVKMAYPHQGMFVRRSLFAKFGLFHATQSMDYEHTLRCYLGRASFQRETRPISVMDMNGISSSHDPGRILHRIYLEAKTHLRVYPYRCYPLLFLYWAAYAPYKLVKTLLLRRP